MSKINLTSSFTEELLSEFEKYDLIQDRLAGDVLTLPNKFTDIKINVNDFVVSETINYSLEKLYKNSLYILAKSVIPSNNIPETKYYTHIVNDTGTGPKWKTVDQFGETSGSCKQKSLSGVNKFIKIENTANSSNYNVVATTDTRIKLLSGTGVATFDFIRNPDIPTIVSDSDITHPSNGVLFQGIKDITISASNYLYVLDSTLKTIFKFDISGILTLDDAILKNDTPGRLMVGMVGGTGGLSDKTRFKDPLSIVSVNDYIYVIDYDPVSKTSSIKVYDSQLNWKSTHDYGSQLSSGPVDIKYNPNTRELFVLCHLPTVNASFGIQDPLDSEQKMPVVVRIDIDTMQITASHDFFIRNRHKDEIADETYKSINFSIENPNIMYILTDQNMYKKYVPRPEVFVGKFLIGDKNIGTGGNPAMNFQDFTIQQSYITDFDADGVQYNEPRDEILMFDKEYETIHKFLEESNYEKSLQSDIENNFIPFKDIKIKPDELVSVFVYNKSLIKMLYNNVLILENISRRFTTLYDSLGISQYIGFTYLIKEELEQLTYEQTLDNLIGINEPVMSATVNRCLNRIYQLQEKIVNLVQEKSINVYPLTTTPVKLT